MVMEKFIYKKKVLLIIFLIFHKNIIFFPFIFYLNEVISLSLYIIMKWLSNVVINFATESTEVCSWTIM